MLKMESGATRTASRDGRVDELDAFRRARTGGASQPRMSQEEFQQIDKDVPFWMQENPWQQGNGNGRHRAKPVQLLPGQQSLFGSQEPERPTMRSAPPRTQPQREYAPRPRPERPGVREASAPMREERPAARSAAARQSQRMPGQMEWSESDYYRPGRQEQRAPAQEYRPRSRAEARPPAREARTQRPESARRGKSWMDTGEFEQVRMEEVYEPARRPARADERAAREPERRQAQAPRREHSSRHNGLLLLMALLGLLAVAALAGLQVFEVRSIVVTGNTTISSESIAALSGINLGENILKANIAQAKKNLESDALLDVQSVTRVFPNKIAIVVHERVPHGAISYLGGYVIIDEKGTVLDVRDSLPSGQYPLIVGVEIQPSEKGKPVQGIDGTAHQTMTDLLTALYDKHAMQYIREINMKSGDDIWLLTGEGLEIDLGRTGNFDKKADWIASSVPELRSHGYTSGVLFVTGTGSPVYNAQAVGHISNGSDGGTAQPGDGTDPAANGGDNNSGNAA